MKKVLLLILLPLQCWATSILQQARMVPSKSPEGEIVGYECVDVLPDGVYDKLGLKRGDLIVEINDAPVVDPSTLVRLHERLREHRVVSIQVKRKGKTITLSNPAE